VAQAIRDADPAGRVARMMIPVGPWGDTLKASYFGTQAVVMGSDSVNTLLSARETYPESFGIPIRTSARPVTRTRAYVSCGAAGAMGKDCSGGGGTQIPNITINRQGDISITDASTDRSILNRFGDIAGSTIQGSDYSRNTFGGSGGQGGGGQQQFDENGYPIDPETGGPDFQKVGFLPDWLNNMFQNDCDKICRDAASATGSLDQAAYDLCKKDCDKSNASLALGPQLEKIAVIVLIGALGIAVIYAGVKGLI
jgi:hypothetical protein